MYIFHAQAGYSYFAADLRLKIFLCIFLDYRVLYMSIICLVLVFIVLLASFVRKRKEFTVLFNGKIKFIYHHFHYYATFLFKTPLSTLQYASVNHTLYGKCVMLPQLN